MKAQLEYAEEQALRRALMLAEGDKRRAMEMLEMKKSSFYARLQYYQIEDGNYKMSSGPGDSKILESERGFRPE